MWKRVIPVALAVIFLSSLLPLRLGIGDGSGTTLSVEPTANFGLNPMQQFSINITVSNVVDLYAWQFLLYYQSSVLNGSVDQYGNPVIQEGPFLSTGAPLGTFFVISRFTDNYNDTHGLIWVGCTRVGNVSGVSGSGILATVTFTTVGGGSSVLHLEETELIDSPMSGENFLPHTPIDGWAYVGLVHVTVNDIETPIDIPRGSMAYINVTAENRGGIPETFDVTLYDESIPIETKSVVNLPAGGSQILNYTWDTTAVPMGEYTLNANATTVPGETDMSDKSFSVKVYVGIRDLAAINVSPYRISIPLEYPGMDVRVTVKNKGEATETFNVTLYCGSTFIDTQMTALISGGTGSVTFTWNTSELNYGNYSLLGYVNPLPYEINTADNNFTKYVSVTIPGDINGDFTVNILDAIGLANSFLANPSSPNWNPNADINNDNAVNILDAIILANHFLQHYP
jgi:hypothetical protein